MEEERHDGESQARTEALATAVWLGRMERAAEYLESGTGNPDGSDGFSRDDDGTVRIDEEQYRSSSEVYEAVEDACIGCSVRCAEWTAAETTLEPDAMRLDWVAGGPAVWTESPVSEGRAYDPEIRYAGWSEDGRLQMTDGDAPDVSDALTMVTRIMQRCLDRRRGA